jgi:hypothetical protein
MQRIEQLLSWKILALIIISAGALLFYAAANDSAIFDESAHIPAGYSYVRYLDYRLNHEHPPLVKIFSGIPLLFLDLHFPTDNAAWTTDVNGQWSVGGKFLYEYGNDAEKLIFWARFGPVLLTLFLIFLLYIFARRFLGPAWALLPTLLFGLSPNILAHGHLVTTDIGATFGIVFSFYFFFRYLKEPTSKNIILAGFAFGVAQLLKFSNVLLGPVFIVLVAVHILFKVRESDYARTHALKIRGFLKNTALAYARLLTVFILGTAVIYFVYFVLTFNYSQAMLLRDMHSVIGDLQSKLIKNIAFAIANVEMLKPLAVYVFGISSVFQRAQGGNAAFFLGELSGKGWWYYFPVVYLLKETIPTLLLLIVGLYVALRRASWHFSAMGNYLRNHFEESAMLFFVVFYWANSMTSPLNIGLRHILPTLPFIYILMSISIKKWVSGETSAPAIRSFFEMLKYLVSQFSKILGKYIFLSLIILWFLIEVIIASPNYLSYFNEFVGINNGYRYITDSNYDWGQDLYRLRDFVEKNHIQKIAVSYFGGGSIKYTLGEKSENWWSSRGNPKDQGIEWLAISVNTLSGALGKPLAGFERKPEDEYRWLQNIRDPYKPDAKAGESIFIYKLRGSD